MASKQTQILRTAPFFLVSDLIASVKYFHEVLGFDDPKLWGEPPDFAMPKRDGSIFMLKQAPDPASIRTNGQQSTGDEWDAYVWIRDVDALFGEYSSSGAKIEYGPVIRKHYDMKEFAVRDLDGHIIAFGQHHEGG